MNVIDNAGTHRAQELHVGTATAELFAAYSPKEQAEFIGRLLNLLGNKGLLTGNEIGNLFYEWWE